MAWCLLAGVIGLARAQAGAGLMTTALTIIYVAAMVAGVRPLVVRLAERRVTIGSATLLALGLALSVATSQAIGIHAIFRGLSVRRDDAIALTGRRSCD